MNDLPVIELYQADPRARGHAYGEAPRDRIEYCPGQPCRGGVARTEGVIGLAPRLQKGSTCLP